ncbi:adenylate cyclase [Aureimonas sp. SA4125]|uniref:adenylate/guanylate cyclase domain-containing protein n=1 Tax=Aureimonas sp. SA4125 TaxID=2826993 RepID=UPI001CC6BA8F|nr:adenylate/guanylate cyclase domain-containing protein [Aureimonas sp. SA4125]BDA82614.1 adenylate cyclase [Aureimonas sp. SA4125]
MTHAHVQRLAAWIARQGLAGASETELLDGFCAECTAAGLPLSRAMLVIDTLHPIYEGRVFRWRNDGVAEEPMVEYGRTDTGAAAADWQSSIFYQMLASGDEERRVRIATQDPHPWKHLAELKEAGHADYVAFVHRFSAESSIGEMDCLYSYWVTRDPDGFGEEGLAALRALLPPLALAVKCASLARIAETLVEVYLGRDAGRLVLKGRIARGITETIQAVLWFSDLRDFTTIADAAEPGEIIPLLNDYADAAISAVHAAGGDVMKLIGDGVLAIFKAEDPAEACRSALRAEADLRGRVAALNARRTAEGRPVTTVTLGLHIGPVSYGNIGSDDRLDFTVVGPAVNEVSRISSMCRSVDRGILVSSDFRAATPAPESENLVSVGRYALRGVGRAQELFTLDPAHL